ncbi:MAG TPA: alkaline shock response membrane anchor protein AmaP [Dehalococcoidia bacterium]|nr:alkaline shock response membrane anchor protein AmaP [Dehalococcoidia bacterium]
MQFFNRALITVLSVLLAVALFALVIVIWADPEGGVDRLGDLTSYLDERTDDDLARALISLGAGTVGLLLLMLVVAEVAPAGTDRIRLSQAADGVTELSATSVNRRLESNLRRLPDVDEARAHVRAHQRGVSVRLELWLNPHANLAAASDEACRLVKEDLEERVGVPLVSAPNVYLRYSEEPGEAARGGPWYESVDRPPESQRRAEPVPGNGDADPPLHDAEPKEPEVADSEPVEERHAP